MSRSPRRALLAAAACTLGVAVLSTSGPGSAATAASGPTYPVHVSAANGTITVPARPTAIVSMSPTATEMLYAIGAGSQVKAVDSYSDYPKNAPITKLDALTPNVEAIVAYQPDLVVVSGDTTGLTAQLAKFGIPFCRIRRRPV